MDRQIFDRRKKWNNYEYLVPCIYCGDGHWIRVNPKSDEKLFCSNKCFLAYERDNDPVLQQYNYRQGNKGVTEVELECPECGNLFWVSYHKAKIQEIIHCGHSCASKYHTRNQENYIVPGYHNGRFYWHSNTNSWKYVWRDEVTKQRKNTSGARYVWECANGPIPEGMYVINNNPETLEIENMFLSVGKSSYENMVSHAKNVMRPGWNIEALSRGENHYLWRGGISPIVYPPEFNEKLKEEIRLRDDYSCQICGSSNNLHIHHINRNEKDSSWENLITLCSSCHKRVHQEQNTTDPTILAFQALLQ